MKYDGIVISQNRVYIADEMGTGTKHYMQIQQLWVSSNLEQCGGAEH